MAEAIGTRTLRELSRVVFARLGVVIAIVTLVTGGTLVACLVAQKHYQSAVTFLVKEPRPQNPTAQQVSIDRSLEVFVKTQNELITSETVLARTLMLFELERKDSPVVRQWVAARDAWLAEASQANWKAFKAALAQVDKEVQNRLEDPVLGSKFQNEIRRFTKRVKVETPGGEDIAMSEIFTVTVTQPGVPKDAWRAADLLANSYIDRYREVQTRSSSKSASFIETRLAAVRREKLTTAEAALDDFVNNELKSPSDMVILEQINKAGGEVSKQILLGRLQEQLVDIEARAAEDMRLKEQLLEQLPAGLWEGGRRTRDAAGQLTVPNVSRLDEKVLKNDDPILTDIVTIIPEDTLRTNVVVAQLKTKEVDLLIQLNRMKVEYRDDYQGVRDKITEIASTRRQVLRELIGEAAALDIKIAVRKARQEEITRRTEEEATDVSRITMLLTRYQDLLQQLQLARDEYRQLSSDLAAARQFQGQGADAITINIVDPARIPDVKRPARPLTVLYTIIAFAVGLLLAGAYAFLADHFDHTLQTIEEAERYLGVPVTGSIAKRGAGLLT